MLARKAPIVLLPLALERIELLRRDGHEHRRCIVRRAPHDRAIALLDAGNRPEEIALVHSPLHPRFRIGEEGGVVRELLVAVPRVQPVETRAEFLLLAQVEIEILVDGPRRPGVELVVAQIEQVAAGQGERAGEGPRQQPGKAPVTGYEEGTHALNRPVFPPYSSVSPGSGPGFSKMTTGPTGPVFVLRMLPDL